MLKQFGLVVCMPIFLEGTKGLFQFFLLILLATKMAITRKSPRKELNKINIISKKQFNFYIYVYILHAYRLIFLFPSVFSTIKELKSIFILNVKYLFPPTAKIQSFPNQRFTTNKCINYTAIYCLIKHENVYWI